ncbi:hypothetical protein ACTPEF_27040, partial [Clostridioides difficile]
VEDDKPICKFIKVSLETQNYRCVETDNGGTAISLIHSLDPDLSFKRYFYKFTNWLIIFYN